MRKKYKKMAAVQTTGTVPDFDLLKEGAEDFKIRFIHALNFASQTFEPSEQKSFAHQYAKENLDISLDKVPDYDLMTIGSICWLVMNGAEISMDKHEEKMKALAEKYKDTRQDNVVKVDLTQKRTENLIGELEGIIDDVRLRKSGITQPFEAMKRAVPFKTSEVQAHFQRQLNELSDPEAAEGFELNTELDMKCAAGALRIILSDLQKIRAETSEEKAQRVVNRVKRKKKINPIKMTQKMKYKKEDEDFGLKSIQPSKIVTADVLWIFNTKTRKLGKYVAMDDVGLLVKGTTIQNFDPEKSVEKKIRKPEKILPQLAEMGKVEQRTFLDTIRATENALTGRINPHTILLKVY